MKILDMGCGYCKTPRSIGVDFNPCSDADIAHNLNIYPYPFKDNEFDHITCFDIIEHLDNVLRTMEEIYRIGKPDAIVEITGPFTSSQVTYTDPTHKRAFTSRSFDYFVKGTKLYKQGFSDANFEIMGIEYEKDNTRWRWWDK